MLNLTVWMAGDGASTLRAAILGLGESGTQSYVYLNQASDVRMSSSQSTSSLVHISSPLPRKRNSFTASQNTFSSSPNIGKSVSKTPPNAFILTFLAEKGEDSLLRCHEFVYMVRQNFATVPVVLVAVCLSPETDISTRPVWVLAQQFGKEINAHSVLACYPPEKFEVVDVFLQSGVAALQTVGGPGTQDETRAAVEKGTHTPGRQARGHRFTISLPKREREKEKDVGLGTVSAISLLEEDFDRDEKDAPPLSATSCAPVHSNTFSNPRQRLKPAVDMGPGVRTGAQVLEVPVKTFVYGSGDKSAAVGELEKTVKRAPGLQCRNTLDFVRTRTALS